MLVFNFLNKDYFGMQIVTENCENLSSWNRSYKEYPLVSVFG